MAKSRSAKAIIFGSGQALSGAVNLVIAVVLARLLSKLDYAAYRQTLVVYTTTSPFVVLGFQYALYYFLPQEDRRRRGVLVENLLLLTGGGFLLTVCRTPSVFRGAGDLHCGKRNGSARDFRCCIDTACAATPTRDPYCGG